MKTGKFLTLAIALLVVAMFGAAAYGFLGGPDPSRNMGNYRSFSFYADRPGNAAATWMQPGTAPPNPWDVFWFDNAGNFNLPGGLKTSGQVNIGKTNPLTFPEAGGSYGAGYLLGDPLGNGTIQEVVPPISPGASGVINQVPVWSGSAWVPVSPVNSNMFLGYNAGNAALTGSNNLGLGQVSLKNLTSGSNNIGIGYESLLSNTQGSQNTAAGVASLESNTTGNGNSAYGLNSLSANTTGPFNNAFGANALYNNTVGDTNIAIGNNALYSSVSSGYNIAIGNNSMHNCNPLGKSGLSSYLNNISIGVASMYNGLFPFENTAVGMQALRYSNGDGNTAIGISALLFDQSGNLNTAVGSQAAFFNTAAGGIVALGYKAIWNISDGNYITAVGDGTSFITPTYGVMTASAYGTGSLGTGYYQYAVAYHFSNGTNSFLNKNTSETPAFVDLSTSDQGVELQNVPIYTGPLTCTARYIYRTLPGVYTPKNLTNGGIFYKIGEIDDNTSTTYTDTLADYTINVTSGSGATISNLVLNNIDNTYSDNGTVNWSLTYSGGVNTFTVTNPTNGHTLCSGSVTGNGTITLAPYLVPNNADNNDVMPITAGDSPVSGSVTVSGTTNESGTITIGSGGFPVDPVDTILVGAQSQGTDSHEFVAGANYALGPYISDVYFGSGVYDTSPQNYTIHGTGGSGSNVAGANVTIAGGLGTGTGVGGKVLLAASPPASGSGSTANSLATALTIQAPSSNGAAIATYKNYTFSQLPACSSNIEGSEAVITDGPSSPTWHQSVTAGGGGTPMKLFCNGTNWTVEAY